jgi:hypothetical protein
MKIFFLLKNSGYLRNYTSVVHLLAAKGHQVQLCFLKVNEIFPQSAIDKEVKDISGVSYLVPPKCIWLWRAPAEFIRVLQTYLRFLDPYYKDAHKLRARAAALVPGSVRWLVDMIVGRRGQNMWSVINFLKTIEQSIPLDSYIVKFFKSNRPDVFLVTPLIDLRGTQIDWLKCAKAMDIKSGLCVASWDNLTNKSLIQTEPDRIFVWNKIQQDEALKLHHIDPSKIVITGAQCYDRLFARRPSTSGEEFRRKVGLPLETPFLLYLCSSRFIAPHEVDFIGRWIKCLRNSEDPKFQKIGVLVRPHPQNASQWLDVNFANYGNVVIYPRLGANPVGGDSLNDFFDSMYHSVATVGINTSPMIESGILNKSAFTILAPEFRDTQEGTLHFHHLVAGGLLNISHDLDEHLNLLRQVLSDQESYQARIKHFIKSFVRPHGLDIECTPIFVEAIENLSQRSVSSSVETVRWSPLVKILLFPWAAIWYLLRKTKLLRKTIRKIILRDGLA